MENYQDWKDGRMEGREEFRIRNSEPLNPKPRTPTRRSLNLKPRTPNSNLLRAAELWSLSGGIRHLRPGCPNYLLAFFANSTGSRQAPCQSVKKRPFGRHNLLHRHWNRKEAGPVNFGKSFPAP